MKIKVLIVCPIGLGNFIMATPAIRLLTNSLSTTLSKEDQSELHLLSLKSGITEMGQASGLFENIYTWDPDKESLQKGLSTLLELRKQKFSHVLGFYPTAHWKFCLFARGIGAKNYVGFDYPHTAFPRMLQSRSIPVQVGLHDVDQNKNLVKDVLSTSLGTQNSTSTWFPMELHVNTNSMNEVVASNEGKLEGMKYYVCHPGSSVQRGMEGKRLPISKFAEVIQRIHEAYGWTCIPIGGPEEQELRDALKEIAPEAVTLHATKSLGETVQIIQQSLFFVGNDSGLMHMAVASGKKCIAFFGPSDEERTGPYYINQDNWKTLPSSDLGRGHLILRNINRPTHVHQKNPRLRYQESSGNVEMGLSELSIPEKWPLVREYLKHFAS